MRKFMTGLLIVALTCIFLSAFINFSDEKPLYQPEVYEKASPYNSNAAAQAVLAGINTQTKAITSFSGEMDARVYRRLTFNLSGRFLLEKPKNCSIKLDSRVGRECEIGSNSQEFWFYSKRMNPPALYYAKHEDLYKTRLKAPFHPSWIVQGLGLEEIVVAPTARYERSNGMLRITTEEISPSQKPVKRVILIDDQAKVVKGQYLYDHSNSLIASIEINEFESQQMGPTPKKVRVVWIDGSERVVMDWTFRGVVVNRAIQTNWARPSRYSPQINMATD
jgi:outer membrane lipoprotein-sorting protein